MIPSRLFLTSGVGVHREKLQSFELALRDAGIERYNLVRVSSILPPGCKIISRAAGSKLLSPGEVVFCVLSQNASNERNRLIAASIGVAIPKDKGQYGYLSEHHSFGQTENVAGNYAEDLAASMLASTLGIEYDEDICYDEKREIWRLSGKIVKTRNITKSAVVGKDGRWTTVVAAAVMIP
ncbi:MAG: arginine decarboxylase, pyruvoyl-dependent [Methanobacteriota archaeon]|nr:MAG: arginine decarboxylase, pyruvoyl-dependent [Euryarchaeota archaeon]